MRVIMWTIYGLFWLAIINTCHAFEINCYSDKTRIYHGWGHNATYSDGYIMFVEDGTKSLILITADCIVLEPLVFSSKKLYEESI